jgi:hypothetical protein
MSEVEQAVVDGTLEWAHLTPGKPNDMSGKYQVDVCNLTAKAVKALKDIGLTIQDGKNKGKPEKGHYITPKATKPVTIVDSKRNPFTGEERIGNGTTARVAVRAFAYNFKGKDGIGAGLQALQILDLKEYNPAAMFSEEEGYESEPVAKAVFTDPWPEKESD